MGMTTTGGSGTGTTAVTVSTCTSPTIFTTPSTANAFFIVTITWGITASVPATGCEVTIMGLGGTSGGSAYVPPPTSMTPLVIKVGPNTDVKLTMQCCVGSGTVNWSYNWVGIVVT